MITVEVLSVRGHGTVSLGYCIDPDTGLSAAIAIEPRMARDLAHAIAYGGHPLVDVEDWQLLMGFPAWPDVVATPDDLSEERRADRASERMIRMWAALSPADRAAREAKRLATRAARARS